MDAPDPRDTVNSSQSAVTPGGRPRYQADSKFSTESHRMIGNNKFTERDMATVAARSQTSPAYVARHDRLFYSGIAVAMALTVLFGFGQRTTSRSSAEARSKR